MLVTCWMVATHWEEVLDIGVDHFLLEQVVLVQEENLGESGQLTILVSGLHG